MFEGKYKMLFFVGEDDQLCESNFVTERRQNVT